MATVLRPYQKRVVKEASDFYQMKKLAVLMQMPTGAGKTRTAGYIVEKYAATQRQVLWLVHRDELLMQAAMTFAENGVRHRVVASKSSERAIRAEEFREFSRCYVDDKAVVVVASIQTIVRRKGKLPWLKPSQIVADECHLSLSATWREVIGWWHDARLLGLTATPWRLDKQSFARAEGGLYDEIVIGPSPGELMRQGSLADYELYAPPIAFKTGVKQKIKGGDFDPKTLEAEFDTPVIYGDVVAHYRKYSHGKPAIGFCPTVAVSEKFAEAFRSAGYRAIALDGCTDDAIRRRSLKQLANGELDVIMSVSILVEGTDVPYATTALWLRRTQSLSMYLQGTGRVLRPHPKKERAIILDFVGVTKIHGYPDDEREWSLSGECKRTRNSDGEDVKIQTCPSCYAIHPPLPACPRCGHEYTPKERREIEQVAGDLIRVTAEQREADRLAREAEKKAERQKRNYEERQAESLEGLIELAKSRGYKFPVQWAKHKFGNRKRRPEVEII